MKKESYYGLIEDNTMDISSPHEFNFMINKELRNYASSVKDLKSDIKFYIKTIKEDDYNLLNVQSQQNVSASKVNGFFRRFERNQYNVWILQYLITFLTKLPLEEDIVDDLADPFLQFKSFVKHNIELLTKDDVVHAILRYLRERGLHDNNMEYYKWWIKNNYEQMFRILQSANKPLIKGWRKLLIALQRLCLFWFSVKNQDLKSVRRGDVYMYLVSKILLKQILDTTMKSKESKTRLQKKKIPESV